MWKGVAYLGRRVPSLLGTRLFNIEPFRLKMSFESISPSMNDTMLMGDVDGVNFCSKMR